MTEKETVEEIFILIEKTYGSIWACSKSKELFNEIVKQKDGEWNGGSGINRLEIIERRILSNKDVRKLFRPCFCKHKWTENSYGRLICIKCNLHGGMRPYVTKNSLIKFGIKRKKKR